MANSIHEVVSNILSHLGIDEDGNKVQKEDTQAEPVSTPEDSNEA